MTSLESSYNAATNMREGSVMRRSGEVVSHRDYSVKVISKNSIAIWESKHGTKSSRANERTHRLMDNNMDKKNRVRGV